jgi:hypothetical protein
MNTNVDLDLVAHIRRLSSDGAQLYIRLGVADVARLALRHGQRVEIEVGGNVRVTGIVKTSGSSPWLARGGDTSSADITAALRKAGFEHGDDVPAVIRFLESSEASGVGRPLNDRPARSPMPASSARQPPGGLHFDAQTAIGAVRAYNAARYRGRFNVDVDREGYERFRNGLPNDKAVLVELIRFVGEAYGGAQRRFLPDGLLEESALIVAKLRPVLAQYRAAVATVRPLADKVPDEATLAFLLAPFAGTRRWPVWASKTLHFLRPDAFPILDSRAKKALGIASLGSSPRDYGQFCALFRDTLVANGKALAAAREIDGATSPSDLKLLDKVLYQLGG